MSGRDHKVDCFSVWHIIGYCGIDNLSIACSGAASANTRITIGSSLGLNLKGSQETIEGFSFLTFNCFSSGSSFIGFVSPCKRLTFCEAPLFLELPTCMFLRVDNISFSIPLSFDIFDGPTSGSLRL
ncbi:unnamed protein product [Meloidogyne enterolobii]|uniref:Uncharacterized protein n=1 Tax=Meloidogyne enterolobii TaxID=390850 RepID=A0ACB0YVS4_MELEN